MFSWWSKSYFEVYEHIWSIKCRLITKQIINFTCNCETNLLSLINPLLANVYCSTTLSNHSVIRLKRFVSRFTCKLCNWFFCPYLMLFACVQIFDVTKKLIVWRKKFEYKQGPNLAVPLPNREACLQATKPMPRRPNFISTHFFRKIIRKISTI